jgi:hypothetical protein
MTKIEIQLTAKALKGKGNLNSNELTVFDLLEHDLRKTAGKPHGRGWKSLSPLPQLGKDAMHCHLSYRKVVQWRIMEEHKGKETYITIRLEYIGTREKAPY